MRPTTRTAAQTITTNQPTNAFIKGVSLLGSKNSCHRSRDRALVLDGEGEAQLVAIACSGPPKGRVRWTLHLLADELRRYQIVHIISHETLRKVPKKTILSWRQQMWCIPPQQDAAFVECLGGTADNPALCA